MSVHVVTPQAVNSVGHEQTTFASRPISIAARPAALRIQANMRRGTGSSVPGTQSAYLTLDEARDAAREALDDDRVLRITVVTNTVPPRFVEWVNR